MKTEERVEKIYNEMVTGSLGEQTAKEFIRTHLKSAVKEDRKEVYKAIKSKKYDFKPTFWIYVITVYYAIFSPKKYVASMHAAIRDGVLDELRKC